MGYFDYSREPRSDIAFVDMKSFYASVECVDRGLHPLKTSLCVMSRAYDLPFDVHTHKFSYYNAKRQGLPTTPEYVAYIEIGQRRLGLCHREWTATLRKI